MTAEHRCGGCENHWTGSTTSHCSACHITFGSVRTFDKHQTFTTTRTVCQKPRNMPGVTLIRAGVYDVPRSTPRIGNAA